MLKKNHLSYDRILQSIARYMRHRSFAQVVLQAVLEFYLAILLVFIVFFQVTQGQLPTNFIWRFLTVLALFLLSRTRYHKQVAIVFVLLLLFQPYIIIFSQITVNEPRIFLISSILVLPLTFLMFTGRLRAFLLVLSAIFIPLKLYLGYSREFLTFSDLYLFVVVIAAVAVLLPFFSLSRYALKFGSQTVYYDINMLERIPDLVMVVFKTRIDYMNPAGLRMLGIKTPEDLIGKSLQDIIPDSDAPQNLFGLAPLPLDKPSDWCGEATVNLQQIDGHLLPVNITVTLLDPEVSHILLMTAKPIPVSLDGDKDSDAIIETSDVIFTIHTRDEGVVFVSGEFERLTGVSREELLSLSPSRYRFVHADDIERVSQWVQQMFDDTYETNTLEYRMVTRKETIFWVRATASKIRYAGKPAFLFTTVVIDDYVQERFIANMLGEMPVSYLLAKETHGQMRIVGGQWNTISTAPPIGTIIGQPLTSILEDAPSNLASLLKAQEIGKTYERQGPLLVSTSSSESIMVAYEVKALSDYPDVDCVIIVRSHDQQSNIIKRIDHLASRLNDYAYLLRDVGGGRYELSWAGRAFEEFTGYRPTDQDILKHLIHPDDFERVMYHYSSLVDDEVGEIEYRIVPKSNPVKYVKQYSYRGLNNKHMIYVSVTDVTERVFAQNTIADHDKNMRMLGQIGVLLASSTIPLDTFIEQVVHYWAQTIGVKHCTLMVLSDDQSEYILKTVTGGGWDHTINRMPNEYSDYFISEMGQQIPVIISDWSQETRFVKPELLERNHIQSSIHVVIPLQDKQYGVFSLHDTQPNALTASNAETPQIIANVIGTYVYQKYTQSAQYEYDRVMDGLAQINVVLNDEIDFDGILKQTLEIIATSLSNVDSANFLILDEGQETATIQVRHNVSPTGMHATAGQRIRLDDMPLYKKMIETREPMLIPDVTLEPDWYVIPETNWIRSAMSVPLFFNDEFLGALYLDSAKLNAFTEEDLRTLRVFMAQANTFIQNVRYAQTLQKEVKIRTKELETERTQLQTFFQATGEGIFYSTNRNILFANQKFCDMLGYTESELIGAMSYIFRPDEPTEQEKNDYQRIKDELETDGITHANLRFKRKDNTVFPVSVTASLVSRDESRMTVAIVRDISEEVELKEKQERFLSNAAHELRNPINRLNLSLYKLKRHDTILREDLDPVSRTVATLLQLTTRLLDISSYQTGKTPLASDIFIVQDVLMEIKEDEQHNADLKNITLMCDIPAEPIPIVADKLRFIQIMTNLITNALNYTQEGGMVRVTLSYQDERREHIRIEVIDNGIGIEQEKQSRIFEPFYRVDKTEGNGTGLGLNIVKQYVEDHGGSIRLESLWGVGTTFFITLPTRLNDFDDMELDML